MKLKDTIYINSVDGTIGNGIFEMINTIKNDIPFLIGNNYKVLDDDYYFTRNAKVVIAYTAGWATIPNAIKLATLRIAALMYDEAHGNIGITGKQFADLSKQFINYSNYDKYLRPLSRYRAGGL